MIPNDPSLLKGRGAQINPSNPFLKKSFGREFEEAIDEPPAGDSATEYFTEFPKNIINKVKSPDIGMDWSMNPYQGCEHGCIYCYARNTHTYWGFSAGLDFERKIIYKPEAAELLRKSFENPKWKPGVIMFSGNTDCYQPLERKLQLTRKMLEVILEFGNPVGMITKNSLILRDLDLLSKLAEKKLVQVVLSITTLDENLRRKMEPRASAAEKRFETIRRLSESGIPTSILMGPVIPGLNSHEIPEILRRASEAGACGAGYTMVRLNGQVGEIFSDWIEKNFPDKAQKVLNQIAEVHGGSLNDSRFGKRMKGDGQVAEAIASLFKASKMKYFKGRSCPEYDLSIFKRPPRFGQLELF